MILEGLLTTLDDDRTVNTAPMGATVDAAMERITLRPFRTSATYRNLRRDGTGVFHVTDDVEMLARAAVDRLSPPSTLPCAAVDGVILAGACRWYAVRVESYDDSGRRASFICRTAAGGELRPFFGLNRAKHAVVEGAVLATRLHLLPSAEIARQFAALRVLIEKTGGPAEQRAWDFLEDFVRAGGVSLDIDGVPRG